MMPTMPILSPNNALKIANRLGARKDAARPCDLSDQAISGLQELIRGTEAVERMERMISGFTDDAERALANAGIPGDAAEAMRALGAAAITRTA